MQVFITIKYLVISISAYLILLIIGLFERKNTVLPNRKKSFDLSSDSRLYLLLVSPKVLGPRALPTEVTFKQSQILKRDQEQEHGIGCGPRLAHKPLLQTDPVTIG